jgi:MFS family permease
MGGKLYGVFFFTFAIGAMLGFVVMLLCLDGIGYEGIFWILAALDLISLIFLLFFKEENQWSTKAKSESMKYLRSDEIAEF